MFSYMLIIVLSNAAKILFVADSHPVIPNLLPLRRLKKLKLKKNRIE
jgi:hypothetical protein